MLGTACFGNKSIVEDVEILLMIQLKEHRLESDRGMCVGADKGVGTGLKMAYSETMD